MAPKLPKDQICPLAHRINDACGQVGLGRSTLYKLIGEGKLKAIKIAGRTLIPHAELERLISEAV
ncbi:helix-turn-helix domain-containing protein [Pinisolibacter sp.]|uniref:helix-turn-helix domain-containing protein n=1 Tax=Pinisolibacter sp. TaxID=2172024 RepID=UPI002FDCE91C